MKFIEATIRTQKLEPMMNALAQAGFQGLTVTDIREYGSGKKQQKEVYRGTEYTVGFDKKVKVEMVVTDDSVQKALDIISETTKTGEPGDGNIFVSGIEQTYRIRTGEFGDEAL